MIGQLRGTVWLVRPPSLVLGAAGVGYEVDMPLSAFVDLPIGATDVVIHTHQVVREDGASLFGFLAEQERNLFRQLLKINGIGPRLGLVLLSSLPSHELVQCIEGEDITRLTKVPGIGKKTAERLLLELRGKLVDFQFPGGSGTNRSGASIANNALDEAEAALVSLGYPSKDAQKMLKAIPDSKNLDVAEVIRQALREAGR